jgi:hypothetical protein
MGSAITHLIKTEAARLGFDLCGICRCGGVEREQ